MHGVGMKVLFLSSIMIIYCFVFIKISCLSSGLRLIYKNCSSAKKKQYTDRTACRVVTPKWWVFCFNYLTGFMRDRYDSQWKLNQRAQWVWTSVINGILKRKHYQPDNYDYSEAMSAKLVKWRTRKVLDPPMTSIPSGLNPLLRSMTVSRPGMTGQVAGSARVGRDDEPLDEDWWPPFLPPGSHNINFAVRLIHCALSLAAQCIVIGPVCEFVGLCVCGSVTTITPNYVHRSSPNWVFGWR